MSLNRRTPNGQECIDRYRAPHFTRFLGNFSLKITAHSEKEPIVSQSQLHKERLTVSELGISSLTPCSPFQLCSLESCERRCHDGVDTLQVGRKFKGWSSIFRLLFIRIGFFSEVAHSLQVWLRTAASCPLMHCFEFEDGTVLPDLDACLLGED